MWAGRGISFLPRSATAFYSHPDISYVPIPDLAPDQACLAMAATRTSPVVNDFFTAAQATAEITENAETTSSGSLETVPFQSTAEQSDRQQQRRQRARGNTPVAPHATASGG